MPTPPNTIQSLFIDNHSRGKIGDFLRERIKPGAKLSFVSAYFTIYAFEALQEELEQIDSLNFLFGEPHFIRRLDPEKSDKMQFRIVDRQLALKNKLRQKSIAQACAQWIKDKVEIRSVKESNLLHGKMYYINDPNDNEQPLKAVVGSSNFTRNGLGMGKSSNIELNMQVDANRDVQDLKRWFDELWDNNELIEDVKAQVLQYLDKLYADYSPEFVYYKTLYHIFQNYLPQPDDESDLAQQLRIFDTQIWNDLYDFQKQGVKVLIDKLNTYNGAILADSVGLGKTFTALAVIRFFEMRNQRVLVLCPKRIISNWEQFVSNNVHNPYVSEQFSFDVLAHTDLTRDGGMRGNIRLKDLHWGNYDLVVIDESHNFRNKTGTERDEHGNITKMGRYAKLVNKIMKEGVNTKVLMLSATPVNNTLRDLRNQIDIITRENHSAFTESLKIDNYEEVFTNAQRTFSQWAEKEQRNLNDLLAQLDTRFFKLLDNLTLARSRRHIEQYYDISSIGGGFPERKNLPPIFPLLDTSDESVRFSKLYEEIDQYNLSIYYPSQYLHDDYINLYDDPTTRFKQSDRERSLINMLKVGYLKRLESSVNSFRISISRTLEKVDEVLARIREFEKGQSVEVDLDVSEADEEAIDNPNWEVGAKIRYKLEHIDTQSWKADLEKDRQQLVNIVDKLKPVDAQRDAKLQELKRVLQKKIEEPTQTRDGRLNKKVLVFTTFADTAEYLYQHINTWAQEKDVNTGLVTGGRGGNKSTVQVHDFNEILMRFSPVAQHVVEDAFTAGEGIDILIATDCLSEGQNLQDCDMIVNYDIHWNPVRILQRFGRINRLGTRNDTVYLQNFWPMRDLEAYINLKKRVESRMHLVDITATGDENILSDKDHKLDEDYNYRVKQLQRLKDEVFDLEDLEDSVDITDLTLEEYRLDLLHFIENNRERLAEAPIGINTLVPAKPDDNIKAGVVFCLEHQGGSDRNQSINTIHPYYLIYLQDDGEIRYNFKNAHRILEICRKLCAGNDNVHSDLVELFDRETSQGRDMEKYNMLLKTALKSIQQKFKKGMTSNLASSRDAQLVPDKEQPKNEEDFELITWFVIR